MIIEILISILLLLSVWANVFLIKRLLRVSENINNIAVSIEKFSKHINKVYSLEMYYGDEVLVDLLEHSHEVLNDIENFQDAYGGELNETSEEEATP